MSRSDIMRAVKRAHTGPEIIVRQALHALGLRFRLHRRDLPGSPDIVLPRFRTVVFVHGCFWHRHPGCRYASTPKTRFRSSRPMSSEMQKKKPSCVNWAGECW